MSFAPFPAALANMNVFPTRLPEVLVIEPKVHRDDRGYFVETYHARRYAEAGLDVAFVQDNQSRSVRGTLRGLHWQVEHPQGKLVRVLSGEIFDVAVDIRPDSPRFGHWVGVSLSAENFRQIYVPPGFAHGFCVTSEIGGSRIQVHRLLHAERRTRIDLERSGSRHRVAGRDADPLAARSAASDAGAAARDGQRAARAVRATLT